MRLVGLDDHLHQLVPDDVAVVEVKPAIALTDYKGVEVEHAPVAVTADDLSTTLDHMREQQAQFHFWQEVGRRMAIRDIPEPSAERQRLVWVVAGCVAIAHGINIKLAKSGGIREAVRMAHAGRALGLGLMLGCMNESGLAVAAGAQVASLFDHVDLDGNLLIANDPFTRRPWRFRIPTHLPIIT